MVNFFILILLLVCFYLLGKSADLVIIHIRHIAKKLGITIFFLGLILGFLTTLPELSIGINSVINNIEDVSLGNLLGGVIVLFGLVLGLSIILNRKVKTDGKISHLLPIFVYLFLPMLLSLDGRISYFDGILIMIIYICLVLYLYSWNKNHNSISIEVVRNGKILKDVFFILLGGIMVIIFSNIIVRFTLLLLESYNVPELLLGLILFSVGTNLPEIIVTLRSWKNKIQDLALSNLIGSSMTNVFLIGILSLFVSFEVKIDLIFIVLAVFMLVLLSVLLVFYKTDKSFSTKEGVVLIVIYLLFLFCQVYFFANMVL